MGAAAVLGDTAEGSELRGAAGVMAVAAVAAALAQAAARSSREGAEQLLGKDAAGMPLCVRTTADGMPGWLGWPAGGVG